jgi:hypothetical protein
MDTTEFVTRVLYGLAPVLLVSGYWAVRLLLLFAWHLLLVTWQERHFPPVATNGPVPW